MVYSFQPINQKNIFHIHIVVPESEATDEITSYQYGSRDSIGNAVVHMITRENIPTYDDHNIVVFNNVDELSELHNFEKEKIFEECSECVIKIKEDDNSYSKISIGTTGKLDKDGGVTIVATYFNLEHIDKLCEKIIFEFGSDGGDVCNVAKTICINV